MIYQNTESDASGAHPQYYEMIELLGQEVEVVDTSGRGTVQLKGVLQGGKSPYNEFILIVDGEIGYSVPHYNVFEIEGGQIKVK